MPIKDCIAAREQDAESVISVYKGNNLVESKDTIKAIYFSPSDHSYSYY